MSSYLEHNIYVADSRKTSDNRSKWFEFLALNSAGRMSRKAGLDGSRWSRLDGFTTNEIYSLKKRGASHVEVCGAEPGMSNEVSDSQHFIFRMN